jgi:hypothetical protein
MIDDDLSASACDVEGVFTGRNDSFAAPIADRRNQPLVLLAEWCGGLAKRIDDEQAPGGGREGTLAQDAGGVTDCLDILMRFPRHVCPVGKDGGL